MGTQLGPARPRPKAAASRSVAVGGERASGACCCGGGELSTALICSAVARAAFLATAAACCAVLRPASVGCRGGRVQQGPKGPNAYVLTFDASCGRRACRCYKGAGLSLSVT